MNGANNILRFNTREQWRRWLQDNYDKESGIWFVFPLKSSNESAVSYNDAVEEALCFGWIDSTVKALDKNHKIQRFSPRNPKSGYSQANKERLYWLVERGMICPNIMESVSQILSEDFIYPEDIVKAIKSDAAAWVNFQQFSDSYKRIRIAYIEAARKRPDEYKKRLDSFINKTRKGLFIPGYGGIDKYY